MQENILNFFNSISNPVFDGIFTIITMLGEKYFLLAIAVFIFWNVSKKKGFVICYIFMISMVLNNLIKLVFQVKRPFEVMKGIAGKRVHTATGSSLPSGHTQSTATMFISLAILNQKIKVYIFAILFSILVGISRLYLGVHWPLDVLAGLVLGIIIPHIFFTALNNIFDKKEKLNRFIYIVSSFLILSTVIVYFVNELLFNGTLYITDYLKIAIFSIGASVGFILEEKIACFTTESTAIKKIIRFIIGFTFAVIILAGLKIFFGDNLLSTIIRYLLTGLWITFGFPYLGIKVKLFIYQKIEQ